MTSSINPVHSVLVVRALYTLFLDCQADITACKRRRGVWAVLRSVGQLGNIACAQSEKQEDRGVMFTGGQKRTWQ